MKVSIITISYNSEETIEATIKSVLDQTYDDIEYIIIDGRSTDSTMNIVNKYKDDITLISSEPDKGLYDAMNKGIDRATGDVVGILNSDDLYAHKKVIEHVITKMRETRADGVYADLKYVDREDISKVRRTWISGPYKENAFRKGWMPPHPTFFVKRIKYLQLGTYNLGLRTSADYELMLRFIHKHKIRVVYLPEVTILMRVGGQSNISFRNRIKANKEDRKAWRINGLRPALFTHIRKPLSKVRQFLKR